MAYETLSSTAIFPVPSPSVLPLSLLCVNSNRFFALLKPSRLPAWGLCNLPPGFLGFLIPDTPVTDEIVIYFPQLSSLE